MITLTIDPDVARDVVSRGLFQKDGVTYRVLSATIEDREAEIRAEAADILNFREALTKGSLSGAMTDMTAYSWDVEE